MKKVMGVAAAYKFGRLSVEAERRQRRRAGAVLVWHDRKAEMGNIL